MLTDGRAVDAARGVPSPRQGRAAASAAHHRRDPVASRQRRQAAGAACRARPLVDGRADLHPLGPSRCLGAPAGPGPGTRPAAWHELPGWHQHPDPPEGGRSGQKRDAPAQRDHREALGRSRGGYGTKAWVLADAHGRATAFVPAPGRTHELPHAVPLLDRLPRMPGWVVADRGCTSHASREHFRDLGAQPARPTQRHEAPVACPDWIHVHRNQVERLWARLKEWRAVATRYKKTACSSMGVPCLKAALDWIRDQQALVGAQELPNILDRVQFGCTGR